MYCCSKNVTEYEKLNRGINLAFISRINQMLRIKTIIYWIIRQFSCRLLSCITDKLCEMRGFKIHN